MIKGKESTLYKKKSYTVYTIFAAQYILIIYLQAERTLKHLERCLGVYYQLSVLALK